MFHLIACSAASHIPLSLRPASPPQSEALQALPLRGVDLPAGASVPGLVLCRHREEAVLCGAAASAIASMIVDEAVALHGAVMGSARAAHACESCCLEPWALLQRKENAPQALRRWPFRFRYS